MNGKYIRMVEVWCPTASAFKWANPTKDWDKGEYRCTACGQKHRK